MNIIGITGIARSGKDTLAGELASKQQFTQLSFADPIRQAVALILNVTTEELEFLKETPMQILGGKTPRVAMQTLGTEWGQGMINPQIWVNVCMDKTRSIINAGGRVAISDVRFNKEAEFVRAWGGTIIEVARPGNRGSESGTIHASEIGIHESLIDLRVTNTADPSDMYRQLLREMGFLSQSFD